MTSLNFDEFTTDSFLKKSNEVSSLKNFFSKNYRLHKRLYHKCVVKSKLIFLYFIILDFLKFYDLFLTTIIIYLDIFVSIYR